MPTFIFTYRRAAGYTRTPQTLAAWQAWFGSLGGQLTEAGQPVVAHTVLGSCDPDRTEPGGYSLIEAADLEAATALAKGCPHLERGGGVEVGQLSEVPELPGGPELEGPPPLEILIEGRAARSVAIPISSGPPSLSAVSA